MASINYGAKEISVKIVYYGPGLSGKTTNLQVIHQKIPKENKSTMVSLATETDRTLFFDFLPLDLGKIKGFATKFQLYTVPGQVYYNATRKLVLRGVDGVVFVVDSAANKIDENLESFQNLIDNLAEYGYNIDVLPIVIQFNKRDLPNAMSVEELQRLTNKQNRPWTEACAVKGKGVFETLKLIGKTVIDELNRKYSRPGQGLPAAAPPVSFGPAAQPRPAYGQPAGPFGQSPAQQPPMRMAPVSSTARPAASPFAQQQAPQQQPFAPPPPPRAASSFSGGADPFAAASEPMIQQMPAFAPPKAEALPPKSAPPSSGDYSNYNTVNLEPMANAQADAGFGRAAAPSRQSSPAQEKSELDLEIEKYQREIEDRQRSQTGVVHGEMQSTAMGMQPLASPAPQPAQQDTFASSRPTQFFDSQQQQGMPAQYAQPQQQFRQPQQQAYAPQQPRPQFGGFAQPSQQYQTFEQPRQQQQVPPQQQQAQSPQFGQQQGYGQQQPAFRQPQASPQMYASAPGPGGGIPLQQPEAQMPPPQPQPDGGDTPLFFTSVDTEKTRKPRKVLNPKDKTGKSFFSKLLGKKEADE